MGSSTSKKPSGAKSGNPAARAAAAKVTESPDAPLAPTPASQWKSRTMAGESAMDLALPSGNVARVRRLSPQDFLESGTIPDPIIGMVEKGIRSKKGLKPEDEAKIARDPKMLKAAIGMMDNALVAAVIEPKVSLPPEEGEERDPDTLYADMVDFEDKSFIFNWAMGGSSDIARFQRDSRTSVARLSTVADVGVPTK